MLFLSRFLALVIIPIAVSGFSISNQVQVNRGATETARFASVDDAHLDKGVSRRVALVTAAALAAGVVSVPQAYATDVPTQRSVGSSTIKDAIRLTNMEKQVKGLEKKNLSTVNSNGAPEKHIPQVTVEPAAKSNDHFNVKVTVPHVMDAEKPHYIQYVWLKDMKKGTVVAVKAFQATDEAPPSLTAFYLKAGMKVKPLLFCNLHGLWEGETLRL